MRRGLSVKRLRRDLERGDSSGAGSEFLAVKAGSRGVDPE